MTWTDHVNLIKTTASRIAFPPVHRPVAGSQKRRDDFRHLILREEIVRPAEAGVILAADAAARATLRRVLNAVGFVDHRQLQQFHVITPQLPHTLPATAA